MVGIRSPDGLVVGSCPRHPGGLGSIPKREDPGKTGRHPVLKYRVPHGSQPRPGWDPDPLMVGIRSPDGMVVGSCPRHPGGLGSIPKREDPGKTGRHPVLKYRVPHGSQPRPGWTPDPLMVGIRSPDGSCTSHLGVLGSIPADATSWRRPDGGRRRRASDPFRIHTTSHAHTARSRIRPILTPSSS
jgi:hypothetical protein